MKKILTIIFSLLLILVLLPITNNEVKADEPINAYTDNCITFSSDDSFSLRTSTGSKTWDGTMRYSTNKTDWIVWDGTSIDAGGTGPYYLYVRGETDNTHLSSYSEPIPIRWELIPSSTNTIACSGNIETLRGATGNNPSTTPMASHCYYTLFFGCTCLTSAPSLPATTLSTSCYGGMFSGCEKLEKAPALPATTLADGCYAGMFMGCTSISSTPILPATKLAEGCYSCMFSDCTGLSLTPNLPATTLIDGCYSGMFSGCENLIAPPYLPVTTLAPYCYSAMFSDCTKLTSAPALPATTLAENCYNEMFSDCTNLKTVPVLNATSLENNCYDQMFKGCTSIEAPADIPSGVVLVKECFNKMYEGCNSLIVNTSSTTGYEKEWKVDSLIEPSNWNNEMFKGINTSSTITDDKPTIGTSYYIKGIVKPEALSDCMKYDATNGFVYEFIKGQASSGTVSTAHIDGASTLDKETVRDVNGVLVKGTDYDVSDGSIKVTFNTSYLNNLSVGTHILNINVRSTDFKVTIIVKNPPAPYVPVNTCTK